MQCLPARLSTAQRVHTHNKDALADADDTTPLTYLRMPRRVCARVCVCARMCACVRARTHVRACGLCPQLNNMNIPGMQEGLAELPAIAVGSDDDKVPKYPG